MVCSELPLLPQHEDEVDVFTVECTSVASVEVCMYRLYNSVANEWKIWWIFSPVLALVSKGNADISKIHDVKVVEEKDGKHTTCLVPSNDPPLEDTQGN